MEHTTTLHVLIQSESDGERVWLVAQCLEHDIAAQAETIQALDYEIQRVIAGRIAIAAKLGVHPFDSLPPAPAHFWDLWNQARRLEDSPSKRFRIEDGITAPWMIPPILEARVT